jgi:hypothetical protein
MKWKTTVLPNRRSFKQRFLEGVPVNNGIHHVHLGDFENSHMITRHPNHLLPNLARHLSGIDLHRLSLHQTLFLG